MSLHALYRHLFGSRKSSGRRGRIVLGVERFEDRTVPAIVVTMIGAGEIDAVESYSGSVAYAGGKYGIETVQSFHWSTVVPVQPTSVVSDCVSSTGQVGVTTPDRSQFEQVGLTSPDSLQFDQVGLTAPGDLPIGKVLLTTPDRLSLEEVGLIAGP